jgi:hypothetical protein
VKASLAEVALLLVWHVEAVARLDFTRAVYLLDTIDMWNDVLKDEVDRAEHG